MTKYDSAGNPLWSRQIGTASSDISYSVAVDSTGNPYISGYTGGSLDGPNAGYADAFLTKYDNAGNLLWSRQIGTSSPDVSNSVVVDASGNAYISGYTGGSLGGPNAGYADAFLTKYDSAGNLLWTRQFGAEYDDNGCSVAVDSMGNAYISGYTDSFYGSFIPEDENEYRDAFLIKYDIAGNQLWSRRIGTDGFFDYGLSVTIDFAGNAYISGRSGVNSTLAEEGYADAFLIKYDSEGNQLWSQKFDMGNYDSSQSVAVDPAGNAYISGWTGDSWLDQQCDAFLVKFVSVPEPSTLTLLCAAFLALGLIRQRCEKQLN